MKVSLFSGFKTLTTILLAGSLGACTLNDGVSSTDQAVSGDPDQVLAWNATAMSAVSGQNPNYQTRDMAIVQAAVFDAVNSVDGGFEPYVGRYDAPSGATANAAAAGAAHYVLKHLAYAPPLPAAQVAIIDNAWAALPASISGNSGIALGEQAAAAVVLARSTDHNQVPPLVPYVAPNSGDPGVWVAVGGAPALVPAWGNVTPFILNDARQFYPEPPPALDSDTFINDLAETKATGSATQPAGTEQWNIAKFWITTAPIIFNPIARNMSVANGLSQVEEAQLLAQLNMTGADAAIACWAAKYDYNFWRPINAIRAAGDTTWNPLVPTPPFPEYVSGHTVISGSMAAVLADHFGDNPGIDIVATSPTAIGGFTRHWSAFSQATEEVINARVWSGIHYRNTDEVGAHLGSQIAQFTTHHALRSNHGHSK